MTIKNTPLEVGLGRGMLKLGRGSLKNLSGSEQVHDNGVSLSDQVPARSKFTGRFFDVPGGDARNNEQDYDLIL
jgi:hypothetical protein